MDQTYLRKATHQWADVKAIWEILLVARPVLILFPECLELVTLPSGFSSRGYEP